MARFSIYSKDGETVRYSGKLRYNGNYLKVSYVEFAEIASPGPIAWEVGDYVEYSHTGLRYRLYYIPQPKKQARRNSVGDAFIYENVQFHAATKMLERAIFHDLVKSDNGIHFSTRESLSTYEDVYGIATRIQECMDEMYPGSWEIKVADGITADSAPELYELLHTQKEFTISGSCLDALTNIYNTWDGIGWVHVYDNKEGKDMIVIGRPNVQSADNTSDPFLYGRGNGLTAIKKSYTNGEDIATRLYVYGSERNLISRFYNRKDILNAESVDIANLMLPVDSWGETADDSGALKPDARKAYIEKDSQVAKYGLIPKRVYFDGGDNDEVYPSIENFTAGELRAAKVSASDTSYAPDASIYPSDERLDEIRSANNPADDGITVSYSGQEYEDAYKSELGGKSGNVALKSGCTIEDVLDIPEGSFSLYGRLKLTSDSKIVIDVNSYLPIDLRMEFIVRLHESGDEEETRDYVVVPVTEYSVERITSEQGNSQFRVNVPIPDAVIAVNGKLTATGVNYALNMGFSSLRNTDGSPTVKYEVSSGVLEIGWKKALASTFSLRIKQIGFDMSKQQPTGDGVATVSMKTGMCGGRDFTVTGCRYVESVDEWELTLKRTLDDGLNTYFPNANYPISKGDRFVILDIMMPEIYVDVASERLLALGKELYDKVSRGQDYYEPEIDAKLMYSSGRALREGMYMDISDEDIIGTGKEYVLIDTLIIDETSDAIPTYKVTLREKKAVSFKESVTGSIDNISSKVVLVGGLARQNRNAVSAAQSAADAAESYSKTAYAQAKETTEMLADAVDGFSEGITPVSVQTMAMLVGSTNLQFVFVRGYNDISAAETYPVSFDNDRKQVVCTDTYLQHLTLGITDLSTATSRAASDYYIWKIGGYSSLALEGEYAKYAYYIYAKVKKYDKAAAVESDRTGSFEISRTPHTIDEEDGFMYLLVGILSSEVDGTRNFARLHGFSEILPGQIITDRVRSADGKSYLDLQTGNMALGEKLKYSDGVLYLDFLFSENANIGGWIFKNDRLESQAQDKDGNPMVYLDGEGGNVRMKGTMQLSTAYSGKISDSNIFYLPAIDKGVSKYLDMGSEVKDLGKVVRFFNSSTAGGGRYYIKCTNFTIADGYSIVQSYYYAIVDPQEIVEMTCFERTGSTTSQVLGKWEISGRFGYDNLKMQNASGRFPRVLAMGRLIGGDSTSSTQISGQWYDGTDLTSVFSVTREKAGTYKLTLKSGHSLPAGYKVFTTGYNDSDYKAVWYEHSSGFYLYTSDDSTREDSTADFMIFDPNWWYSI